MGIHESSKPILESFECTEMVRVHDEKRRDDCGREGQER